MSRLLRLPMLHVLLGVVILPALALAADTNYPDTIHQGPAADNIVVADPIVRAVPPVSANTGMFFTLKNFDQQAHALVKVDSAIAERVELHTHIMEDGLAKMRPVKDIPIAAGDIARLQPGGYHVMILGLHQPLKEGQTVLVTLHFEDGSSKTLGVPVKRISGGHHHHQH